MQLRHRLSLYLVTVFSIVILIASGAIYFLFYKWMENYEIHTLENKTLLAALYYLEEDEISHSEHETIKDKLRKTISRKDIAIFNFENQKVKGSMPDDDNITKKILNNIRKTNQDHFIADDYFYNGIFYHDNEGDFVVIAREDKTDFNQQLQSLLTILIFVCIGGVVVIYLFSIILGKFAYVPIVNIVNQLKERDNQNFHTPVIITDSYAEIEDLVKTYNLFIARVSEMFHVQKNFIDYVSHELRTPITALLGTLEVTFPQAKSKEEIQLEINKIKQYVQDLEETLNNMMLLSGAKTSFEFKPIRIDEVIWQVVENAVLYHHATIDVEIRIETPSEMIVSANQQLLELAISNLVENAIKYSDNKLIVITLSLEKGRLKIDITDKGIGILKQDIQIIKQNFVRGQNTNGYQGKGIGLSMADIIFRLHSIKMEIHSAESGTTVSLLF
ncbi:MAG: histidine kinase [Flavobacteriia bacterium 40-80]|nr:MAG: histidine kinase [Flavobacteriia bacterium 40-80]